MKTNLRLFAIFAAASMVHAFAFGGSEGSETTSYDSIKTTEPYIAITFDDGPSSMLTPQVLKILSDRGVKATFFVTGENAASHPDIVKQEFAAGHEIGSRSWAHSLFSHETDDELLQDLQRADQAIKAATGSSPKLYSPTDLSFTSVQCDTVNKQYGYTTIFWSVDSTTDKAKGAAAVANTVITQAKPGAIIMASDIDTTSVQALPVVIDTLVSKGYKFVTISDLIAMNGTTSSRKPRTTRTPRTASSSTGSTSSAQSSTGSTGSTSSSSSTGSTTTTGSTTGGDSSHPFGVQSPFGN